MKNPSIKIQKKLYSNVYFCREAMLVHISGGKNELVWKKTGKEGYELYCNQKKVVKVFTEGIGIWSDSMQTGCGDRILSEKQHNTENRMNDSYQSLEQAIKKATPLLGMLPEDDYVIGDFDLLPTIDGEHFWNGNYNNGNLCHAKKYYISGGFIPFDSPMCLFPSERASLLSPERIEYYKERLSEENHYPRAIAYYISGGMTVLLDGHHKVTAAATIGQPIRCLVVMHASIQDREQEVSLNHNRNNVWSNGLQVFDSNEEMVGKTLMVTERKLKQEQHTYWEQKDDSIWGSVPEEYCQSLSVYPNAEFLAEGMAIARNKIKTEFDKLICQVDRENDKDRIRHLLNYCKVFPNNKWITNKEREWLETMEKNIWIYGKITSDK